MMVCVRVNAATSLFHNPAAELWDCPTFWPRPRPIHRENSETSAWLGRL